MFGMHLQLPVVIRRRVKASMSSGWKHIAQKQTNIFVNKTPKLGTFAI